MALLSCKCSASSPALFVFRAVVTFFSLLREYKSATETGHRRYNVFAIVLKETRINHIADMAPSLSNLWEDLSPELLLEHQMRFLRFERLSP